MSETDASFERKLTNLLGEIRNMLLGVQILFAGLLTVPFRSGFAHLGAFEHAAYATAMIASALASTVLIAPSLRDRLERGPRKPEDLIRSTTRLVVIGALLLACAVVAALVLTASVVYGRTAGVFAGAAIGAVMAALWFVTPLRRP